MKYSEFCYTCIFDDGFNIVWTDNFDLFKRLARRHETLKKRLFSARRTDTIYYEFSADKNNYMIKANLLPDRRIICRASRELPEYVLTNTELHTDLDNITFNTLNAISSAQSLQSRIKDLMSTVIDESINTQIRLMTNVYSDCSNILQLYENKSSFEYVPLERFLIRAFDMIHFSIRGIRKDISYCIALHKPVWLIDHRRFELALFNIVKLILILTTYGNGGMITIRSIDDNVIRLTAEFSYQQNYPLCNCITEMRLIHHLFKLMDGEVDFFQERENIILEGYINSKSSYDIYNINWWVNYKPDLEFRNLRERSKNPKVYSELYLVEDCTYLRSPVDQFSDITDPTLMLWRLVFESAADRANLEGIF